MIPRAMLVAFAGLCLLGGCVGNMLGGGKPVALYRFGVAPEGTPVIAQERAPARATVRLDRVGFAREVDGNRLLAVHGASVRYIAGMRWVADAPGLFGQGVMRSFAARAADIQLVPPVEGGHADYVLVLTVGRFEAHYDDAAMAGTPTVVIEGQAVLLNLADGRTRYTGRFAARAVAAQNGAGAIAAAFDTAAGLATAQIADWANATLPVLNVVPAGRRPKG